MTAIPPTAGETFTVGAHGDPDTTYDIGTDIHGNQGRYYGIGVYYTPGVTAPSPQVYLSRTSLGQTNLSWSDQRAQSNWVDHSRRRDRERAAAGGAGRVPDQRDHPHCQRSDDHDF